MSSWQQSRSSYILLCKGIKENEEKSAECSIVQVFNRQWGWLVESASTRKTSHAGRRAAARANYALSCLKLSSLPLGNLNLFIIV